MQALTTAPGVHAGELVLRAFDAGGALVANDTVASTGPAAALALSLEQGQSGLRADGDDVALVTLRVLDAAGRLVKTASPLCTFDVDGPGQLIGVGNGDPSSHEPDHATQRSAFNGLARAIVQATDQPGIITLTASTKAFDGEGATASVRIQVREA